jgi:hypothetical protein
MEHPVHLIVHTKFVYDHTIKSKHEGPAKSVFVNMEIQFVLISLGRSLIKMDVQCIKYCALYFT